mgnify:CR=1 FL=1
MVSGLLKPRVWLTWNRMADLCGIVVVAMLLWSMWEIVRLGRSEAQYSATAAQVDVLEHAVQDIQESVKRIEWQNVERTQVTGERLDRISKMLLALVYRIDARLHLVPPGQEAPDALP